jgi:hypothetical protein
LAPSWDEKAAPLWAAFSLPQTIEAVKRRHGKRPQFVDHQTEGCKLTTRLYFAGIVARARRRRPPEVLNDRV